MDDVEDTLSILPSIPPLSSSFSSSFLIHRPFGPKFHRMIKMIIGPSADHHPDPACAALIAASIEEHTDQQVLDQGHTMPSNSFLVEGCGWVLVDTRSGQDPLPPPPQFTCPFQLIFDL